MDVSAARQQNDEIVRDFGTCTHQEFGPLKDRAMAHTNHVLAQAKTSSAFDQRHLKDGIRHVFRAMQNADRRLHRTEFRFQGPPIPANKTPVSKNREIAKETQNDQKGQGGEASHGILGGSVHISNQTDTSVHLDESVNGKHVHMQNLSGVTIVGHSRPASMSLSGGTSISLNVASDGPIMVQNVSHSVLLVRCHQLRMHGCTDCVIFAELPNKRIVLEHCRRLHMGGISETHLSAGNFFVDDFDWPSNAPNPHYSTITSDKLLSSKRVDKMNAEDFHELRGSFEGV